MREKREIVLSFSLSIITLLAIGFYSVRNVEQYKDASNSVAHSKDVIFEAHNILSYLQAIETSHRGYVITGKEEFLAPRDEALSKIKKSVSRLRELAAGDSIDERLCDSLRDLVYQKMYYSAEIIHAFQRKGFEEAQRIIATDSSETIMDKSRTLIEEIVDDERVHLSSRLERSAQKFSASVSVIISSITLAVLIISFALFFLLRDVSRRARNERQLSYYAKELEVKNRELEQFVKVSSHDLKEPLKTISNYVGLFREEYAPKLDDGARMHLNTISGASAHMKVLIENLLEYTRVGSGKNSAWVDCNSVLEEVLRRLADSVRESQPLIYWDPLPAIQGYREELVLLFENLVSNAIKFRSPERQLRIDISAADHRHAWLFAVKDNGIGIERQYAERIFVLFQRLHNRSDYPGTGIGLALCSKIVKMHGGRIWVDSEPGKGSTFYFTIPK